MVSCSDILYMSDLPFVDYIELSCLVTLLVLLLYGLQAAYDTWLEATDLQKPRGRVLIVANISFLVTKLSDRRGTECDVQRLKSVFEWLNFQVDVHKNLTSHVSYTCLSVSSSVLLLS